MNKKGFALYELLITFSISFVLIIGIFTTIVNLSNKLLDIYKNNKILTNQLLIYRNIGNDFSKYGIDSINACDGVPNCVTISYNNLPDNINKNLIIDKTNNYITYDGNKITFEYITIGNSTFTTIDTNDVSKPKIAKLYIPISYGSKTYNITLFCTNGIGDSITSPFNINS